MNGRGKFSKEKFNKVKKNEIKVRINERIVAIGFYEYYCLKIFIVIYESLSVI